MAHHHEDMPSTSSLPSRSLMRTPDVPTASRTGSGFSADVYGCHRCSRSKARSEEGERGDEGMWGEATRELSWLEHEDAGEV